MFLAVLPLSRVGAFICKRHFAFTIRLSVDYLARINTFVLADDLSLVFACLFTVDEGTLEGGHI
jgi:hypothetical protein